MRRMRNNLTYFSAVLHSNLQICGQIELVQLQRKMEAERRQQDDDDVQQVTTNFEASDEVMEQLAG